MPTKKRLLVIGLFIEDINKNVPTQAMEMASMFRSNGYEVLTVSKFKNRFLRLLHLVYFTIANRKKYDAGMIQVFSGLSLYWEIIVAYILKRLKKEIILTTRGGSIPAKMKISPGRYLYLFRKANKITCPSNFIVHELEKFGIKAEKIDNCIDVSKYKYVKKKSIQPVIFWMRAFSPIYNPEMAVRVIDELKNSYGYSNVKMYMGGPDLGLKESLKLMIDKMKLKDNIELVGFLNMKKKQFFVNQCDIYMCTNAIDNTPVSFLEMMAFGLPIVSTNVGGIPFLVEDNVTACLVDSGDHQAMARKIDELICSPELSNRLISNGIEYISSFDRDIIMKKWEPILENS